MTQDASESSTTPPATPHGPRSPFVFATIVFTMAVTFAMVALICFRWFSWSEPSSMLEVQGDPAAAGVVIRVVRLQAGGGTPPPIAVELSKANDYSARLFLEAGGYIVTAERPDHTAFKQALQLPAYRKLTISLVGRFPSTAPAATAAKPTTDGN